MYHYFHVGLHINALLIVDLISFLNGCIDLCFMDLCVLFKSFCRAMLCISAVCAVMRCLGNGIIQELHHRVTLTCDRFYGQLEFYRQNVSAAVIN